MSTSKQNFLAGNRATLAIEKLPQFIYAVQDYTLPDVQLPPARMGTPFVDIPFAGEKLDFGPLTVSFLVEENLENWNSILKWMIGLGFPVTHKEYQDKEIAYSDATMIIYSNHQNPLATIKLYDIYPQSLAGIEFSSQEQETVYRQSTVSFAVTRYEVIKPT